MAVIHYDKDLSGHIACGYSRYDYAHEDIRKVTCRRCLAQANKAYTRRAKVGAQKVSSKSKGSAKPARG